MFLIVLILAFIAAVDVYVLTVIYHSWLKHLTQMKEDLKCELVDFLNEYMEIEEFMNEEDAIHDPDDRDPVDHVKR